MKFLFLLFFFSSFSARAIVGGQFVTEDDQESPAYFNTVALARVEGNHFRVFCTGSIISDRHILTARHCTLNRDHQDLRILFAHDAELAAPEDYRQVSQKWEYDGAAHWGAEFPNHDIAALEIEGSVPFPYRALPIATQINPDADQALLISGFGNQSARQGEIIAGRNKFLTVKLEEYLDSVFFRHLLYLRAELGSGACHGDSGGPAYAFENGEWIISGVTNGFDLAITRGSLQDTGDPDFPVLAYCDRGEILYGAVNFYGTWIESVTGLNLGGVAPTREELDLSSLVRTCETIIPADREWRTLKSLALKVLSDRLPSETERDVLTNCQRLSELLTNKSELSFGAEDDLSSLSLFKYLSNLKRLNFNGFPIIKLDLESLRDLNGHWPQLQFLDFSNSGLKNLEDIADFGRLFKPRSLRLDLNQLTELSGIESFEDLTELSASRNQISDLAPLSRLPLLEKIDLQANQLQDIETIFSLAQVKEVNFLSNQIAEVDLSQMQSLRSVILSRNPITSLRGLENHVHSLEVLRLSGLSGLVDLSNLDINFGKLTELRDLDLSNAKSLPRNPSLLKDLLKLERLNLANSSLENLAIFQESSLPKLQWLNIAGNNLQDLRGLIPYTSLQTLWLGANPVQKDKCPQDQGPALLQRFCKNL